MTFNESFRLKGKKIETYPFFMFKVFIISNQNFQFKLLILN